MKANVDKNICIGCGACQAIAPDVFEIQDDGLAGICGNVSEDNKSDVIDASESCPTGAIKVESNNS